MLQEKLKPKSYKIIENGKVTKNFKMEMSQKSRDVTLQY